jgi:two-component system chemotaxis response regulator CheY
MGIGANILIVEDDVNVRDTIEDALADEGHSVLGARNGAEALAALKHVPRPALILLDLWMPVMDGLAFLNAFRNRKDRDDFEVVVMSAAVAPEWFSHNPDVVKALKKPFEVGDILSLAAGFSERRPSGGVAPRA